MRRRLLLYLRLSSRSDRSGVVGLEFDPGIAESPRGSLLRFIVRLLRCTGNVSQMDLAGSLAQNGFAPDLIRLLLGHQGSLRHGLVKEATRVRRFHATDGFYGAALGWRTLLSKRE